MLEELWLSVHYVNLFIRKNRGEEDIMIPFTNGVFPPMPPQKVSVRCIYCGYMGTEKLVYSFLGKIKLKTRVCPNCKKKGLVRDMTVMY